MTIVVTDIGTAFDDTSSPVTLTSTVPAGSFIFVVTAEEGSIPAAGTITDDVGNVYTKDISGAINNNNANGWGACFHTYNCKALSAQQIIYTKNISTRAAVMSGFYATGIATKNDPIDTPVSNSAFGNDNSPTVTSGIPSWGEDLFVGATATVGNNSYSGSPIGWTLHPPDKISDALSGVSVEGCYIINTNGTLLTYKPFYSGARQWVNFILAFKSQAADFPLFSIQEALPYRRRVRLLGY